MNIKIIKISTSPLKNKRFRAHLNTEQHIDFGLKNGNTFIDHKDISKRNNYWARHLANKNEKYLIMNLIPSPSLFAAALLWGKYSRLDDNVRWLNSMFKNTRYGSGSAPMSRTSGELIRAIQEKLRIIDGLRIGSPSEQVNFRRNANLIKQRLNEIIYQFRLGQDTPDDRLELLDLLNEVKEMIPSNAQAQINNQINDEMEPVYTDVFVPDTFDLNNNNNLPEARTIGRGNRKTLNKIK